MPIMVQNKLSGVKLTDVQIGALRGDGNGVWFRKHDTNPNAGHWFLKYQWDKKTRTFGLGGWPATSLEQARANAEAARRLIENGINPSEERRRAAAAPTRSITFRQVMLDYHAGQRSGWKSERYAQNWTRELETHAAGLMDMDPADITAPDIRALLRPIWSTHNPMAERVRSHIAKIMDYCAVEGLVPEDRANPASWDRLKFSLPKHSAVHTIEHFKALDFHEVPVFMAKLTGMPVSRSQLCLRLQILTATRPSEAAGARWSEIDFEKRLWTIPRERMKAGRQHMVPLSDAAIAVLKEAREILSPLGWSHLVFAARYGKTANRSNVNGWIARYFGKAFTGHGFRSSFRDWAAERSDQPREICEMALAHLVGSVVERSYRRSELIDRRRALMDAWGAYCMSAPPAVPHPRKQRSDFKQERAEAIIRWRVEGIPVKDIAQHHGISDCVVRAVIHRERMRLVKANMMAEQTALFVKRRNGNHRADRNSEMMRLVSGGVSYQEVADQFGISRRRVHDIIVLERAHIAGVVNVRVDAVVKPGPLPFDQELATVRRRRGDHKAERDAEIVKLYSAGFTCKQIGSRFGLTTARVSQILIAARERGSGSTQ